MGLTEAVGEDRESAVTFASSLSDSEEEEEELGSATPPRPMLRWDSLVATDVSVSFIVMFPLSVLSSALTVAVWSVYQPLPR